MRRTLATVAVARELLRCPDAQRWAYELARCLKTDRGSVNNILQRMVDSGWLSEQWESQEPMPPRPRRHYYKLTLLGRDKITKLVDFRQREEMAS